MTNQTERADDLLPCPLCEWQSYYDFFPGEGNHSIWCMNNYCGVRLDGFVTKNAVVKMWNTRSKGTQEWDQKRGEELLSVLNRAIGHLNDPYSLNDRVKISCARNNIKEAIDLIGSPGDKNWCDHYGMPIVNGRGCPDCAALEQPSIPPGYALVPIEPTEEMIRAAMEETYQEYDLVQHILNIGNFAAAPKQEKSE